MQQSELISLLKPETAKIDQAMRQDLASIGNRRLQAVLDYAIFNGGKRVRPLLTILAARLCWQRQGHSPAPAQTTALYQLALTFEYLHAASLLHDDVIDHADSRRGRTTANRVWDNAHVILAGDFLHTRAMLLAGTIGGAESLTTIAAATGAMPLVMPESVLIRFTGRMQPGITLRDLVNAIPWVAMQKGLLTVEKKGKKNIFAGTVLEIEGLPDLAVEQAFELADASAERSAAACTVRLNEEPVAEFLRSNVVLLQNLLTRGYQDALAIRNRIAALEAWLAAPALLAPDADAEYKAVLTIDLNTITEPLLACPNDPDDVKLLSEVAGTPIDEVFVGSCMTNIGHFRALARILDNGPQVPVRLWVAPPTRMDEEQLKAEGVYSILGRAGARTEIPGCSLCMGNQARTRDKAVVFSTSTRNFDNRIGTGARVFLGSAELAAVCAVLGRIPTLAEYQAILAERVTPKADEVYRYLNFKRIAGYAEKGW